MQVENSTPFLQPPTTRPRLQTTSLHLTARHGRALALGQLMAAKFIDINAVDAFGCTPLDYAIENGNWACAVLLITQEGVHLLRCSLCRRSTAVSALQTSTPRQRHRLLELRAETAPRGVRISALHEA